MSLSNEVKAKLAHSYLVSQATGSQPVPLVPAAGGCRLPVVLGKQPAAPPVQLTHQEVNRQKIFLLILGLSMEENSFPLVWLLPPQLYI